MEIKVLNTLNSEYDGKLTTPNVSAPMNKHTPPCMFRRAIEVAACELWIRQLSPNQPKSSLIPEKLNPQNKTKGWFWPSGQNLNKIASFSCVH